MPVAELGPDPTLSFRLAASQILGPCPFPCGSLRMVVLRVMPEMLKPHRKRKTV